MTLGVEEEARLLDAAELKRRCDSPRFRKAVHFRDGAVVQPARLALALKRAALDAGVEVYEHTPVTAVEPGRLETPGGAVRAREIVLALNVWGTRWPLGGRQTNFGSAVVLTEPVPELLEEIGWTGGEAITDGRMFLHYFRTTPDGRVLMGSGSGRLGLGDHVGPGILDDLPAQARAERGLRELLPALAAAPIAARWSGPIDVSADKLPRFETMPGARIHYGAGYSGNGVGPSWLGGQILASLALGVSGRVDRAAARRPRSPAAAAGAVPLCRREGRALGHPRRRGGGRRGPEATARGTRRSGDPAPAADADRHALIQPGEQPPGTPPRMSEHDDRYSFPDATDPPSPVQEPSSSLLPAIAAGVVAALVGGIVWGLIAKFSDYEVGIVAWGIGYIAGHRGRARHPGREGPDACR